MASRRRHLVAALIGLVGCGPTGPSGEAETLAASESGGATETGTDDGGCEWPVDEAPTGAAATITIRNDSAAPAYVIPNSPFSCSYSTIQIEVAGAPIRWDASGYYPVACDECDWGCSDGGWDGLIINPGATAEVAWNGTVWQREALSPECTAVAPCENGPIFECDVREAGFTGEYTAVVELAQTCPSVDEACVCDQDVCPLFVYEPSQIPVWQRLEASASFPAGAELVIPP